MQFVNIMPKLAAVKFGLGFGRVHANNGPMLSARVGYAESVLARCRGLIGSPISIEGLWLPGTRSIHTWFMKFSIDVYFLDENGTCLASRLGIRPWRVVIGPKGTRQILELRSSSELSTEKIVVGETLEFVEELH
jgi:uncharacterized membrane protein (UPF0127 family)